MSTVDHPFGFTDYEIADELGLPSCRQLGTEGLAVWTRLSEYPEFAAEAYFFISSSGPQLIGLTINPWSHLPWPPPLLTTAAYRSAPTARLYEQARGYLSLSREIGLTLDVDLSEFESNRRPGRKGRPDVFYAELAKQYVEVSTVSSTPTKDLAERLGYSPSSVRDFLHQARRRDLLSPAVKGMAGGELTNKAMWLLAAKGEEGNDSVDQR